VVVIPHGPYDQHQAAPVQADAAPPKHRPFSLLYFGVIRPFKGVEDLVRAFDQLTEEQAASFSLTVAGETWENWTLPGELIAASRYADRITFLNRYLTDDELADALSRADAVVLPYHRSSASGPLHTAMSNGLPVVVSAVGGLVEAAQDYEGAVFVPPSDPEAIKAAILGLVANRGARFRDPHSWGRTVASFDALFEQLKIGSAGVNA
jgi:glycosyltransferase involved in cell wall biosynthesis